MKSVDTKKLANELKKQCAERYFQPLKGNPRKYSCRSIARDTGVTHVTVWKIMHQKCSPSIETLIRICHWMGRDIKDFIRDDKIEQIVLEENIEKIIDGLSRFK